MCLFLLHSCLTHAADERTTLPILLRRLAKKCKLNPHLKQTIRIWWDNAQEWLPEEKDDAKREHSAALLVELEKKWDLPDWLHLRRSKNSLAGQSTGLSVLRLPIQFRQHLQKSRIQIYI